MTHCTVTDTLANYSYTLDKMGNRRTTTETVTAVQYAASGAYLEQNGLLVIEAENGEIISNEQETMNDWFTATTQSGYSGSGYLQAWPDIDAFVPTSEISSGPRSTYALNITSPATYTVWLRGYAPNAAGDSVYGNSNKINRQL